jgi:arginine decarboxylase
MADWTTAQSAELYGVSTWGAGYFDISARGDVIVQPRGAGGPAVNLRALVEELRSRGLRTPLLIRFSGILASRVREIAGCFQRAIAEYDYSGRYRGVYPIKVNQQRQVVEQLIQYGRASNLGLEVGSKPELLVAIALLDDQERLLVCNGYKDRSYLELALLAQKLGLHCIIVMDRPNELDVLIKVARELGVRPHIGVRARLSARGTGKWAESSGDRSKFGLSSAEIVEVVEQLRREDMLDCFEMLHFHIGSQITAIRSHADALQEASRIFTGLHALGAPLRYVDVGGGLGVDYEGTQTTSASSINYTTQEYAYGVIAAFQEACAEAGVPHPEIVTESGRALVSHASVLVFDVLDVDDGAPATPPARADADEHKIIRELSEIWDQFDPARAQEAFHDATQLKEEAQQAFRLGYLDLLARARAEELFAACCSKILEAVRDMPQPPEELEGLQRQLADTYYGNFSLFQSLPDSWALEQLFPVMPIQRLDEEPTRSGIFADLTCDSDGKIDRFVPAREDRRVLPLHDPGERPYYVGAFLVGAYQETLGEMHNLFGDTDTVHVTALEEGGYSVEHVVEGDRVDQVLAYVQYDRRDLTERVRLVTERALRAGSLTLEESVLLRRRYEAGLLGYTYLEREG